MTTAPDFWPSALGVHALDGGRYTVEKKALDALVAQCYAAEAERDRLKAQLVPAAGVNHDVWVKGTHGKATT